MMQLSQKKDYINLKHIIAGAGENNLTIRNDINKAVGKNLGEFWKKHKERMIKNKEEEKERMIKEKEQEYKNRLKNIPTSQKIIVLMSKLYDKYGHHLQDTTAREEFDDYINTNSNNIDQQIKEQITRPDIVQSIKDNKSYPCYFLDDRFKDNVQLNEFINELIKVSKEKYSDYSIEDYRTNYSGNIGELDKDKIDQQIAKRYNAIESMISIESGIEGYSNLFEYITNYSGRAGGKLEKKTVADLEQDYELKDIYPDNVINDKKSSAYLEQNILPSHKVLWLTERDNKNIENKDSKYDKKEYMPEWRYYETKYTGNELDYHMKKYRLGIIGVLDSLKQYAGYFKYFILRNFITKDYFDIKEELKADLMKRIPKNLAYSPENNKLFIQNVVTRRMCFPLMAIINKYDTTLNDSTDKHNPLNIKYGKCNYNDNNIYGMFILTLTSDNQYPFFIKARKPGKFVLCNPWNTATFIDTGMIADRIRGFYMEINVAINTMTTTGNEKCFLYNVLDDPTKYLFSRYTLDQLHVIYGNKDLDTQELYKLKNVNYNKILYNNVRMYPMFLKQDQPPVQIHITQDGGRLKNDARTVVKEYIYGIYRYKKNKSLLEAADKIDIFEDIMVDTNNNFLLEKEKHRSNLNMMKYTTNLFFIKNYIEYAFKVDKRNYPYDFVNNTSILKTKLISWDIPLYPMIIVNYEGMLNKDKLNIMIISKNYALIEMLKYYNEEFVIDHYYYKSDNNKFIPIIDKIKDTYKFDDYEIDTDAKNKYYIIFADLITNRIYGTEKNIDINTIQIIENDNRVLLDKLCIKLESLRIGGSLLLYSYSFLTKKNILTLEKIINCFKKVKTFNNYGDVYWFPFIYCEGFKGINNKEDQNKDVTISFYNFVKQIYKKNIKNIQLKTNIYPHIENLLLHDPSCDELQQIAMKNMYISNEIASYIGLETYKFKGNMNTELSYNLQNLFSIEQALVFTIIQRETKSYSIKLIDASDPRYQVLQEIVDTNKYHEETTRMIDYRPIHIYDFVKKYVRLYEGSLNKLMFKNGININGSPVSRAWIKMLEILHIIDFKTIPHSQPDVVEIFHICEAPGNFVHSINHYINKYMKGVKYEWNCLTLNPSFDNKNAFGDNYGMIKNNPSRWSYGADETGDITVRANIEYYKEKCSTSDWLIGDCGMGWDPDPQNKIIFLRLYYAQILFILHNLKQGGNFIFKAVIPFEHPLLIDAYYILYNSMEKIQLIKPVQNKFSPEFYVVGWGYKGNVLPSESWDIMFKVLTDDNLDKKSIISSPYVDDFKYQFIKGIRMISDSFCETIRMQLFYVDFWNSITGDIKKSIKNAIDVKNEEFMIKYDLKK